ncbi:MAG: ABC transporter ATP-binding protein [Pseudomonadota bacterium]
MPAEVETAVRITGLEKRFGAFAAVDGVDLEIRRGELFCLLGGSGSGKSTLLRMLAGFEAPDAGRIEIAGQDMAGVDPADRPVNMMFQSYALFPHMSVAENVGYGLRQMRLPRAEREGRVAEMLRLVRMEELARRRPHQLSGGQRQRVALARSLARRPALLLLDEPLSALDRKLREETQFELMDIQESLGTTFIVVTHDQEEAMTLADRIAVMDAGRLAQIGPPREVYEYPATRFVADFIGTVNLIEGAVTAATGNSASFDAPGLGRIEATVRGHAPDPGAAAVAIRPEKLTITAAEEGAPATVEDIAYRGGLTEYRLLLETGARLRATRPNVTHTDGAALDWNDRVGVTVAPGAAVLLAP